MDMSKLDPILTKESTLKTASARELQQTPHDVLQRYEAYALTHVPLGDTTKQLANLRRVITENKTCAVGTIVGPYGYGKTSTAVHLWNELRQQQILAVPPFLWANMPELMGAVYYWIRFEFEQGPKAFTPQLDDLFGRLTQSELTQWQERLGVEEAERLVEEGRIVLGTRPEDVVSFFASACDLCQKAGYQGMSIFTDELQATLAAYRPSRDQFFADLFAVVRDTLGRPGNWAWVISTDDDTEGYIARLRADLLQRLQRSALYFRVRDVYSRREYPAELWAAFEKRFGFDGSEVLLGETLEAVGQVSARADLGAGPRMVTNVLSLGVRHYQKTHVPYTPLQFVDDFLSGQVLFDQRGKFTTAVKKALDNPEVRSSATNERVIKLLSAYPMGCSEVTFARFELLDAFRAFPPLARRELILHQSGGYTLRYLAEEEEEPEQIEQRLTKEFVQRYAPGKQYAANAAKGFADQVVLEPAFRGWKREKSYSLPSTGVEYRVDLLRGSFDERFPERLVAVLVASVPQSPAPQWSKLTDETDLELRFELNYAIAASEPSRLLVSQQCPNVALFQLNLNAFDPEAVRKTLPSFLQEYYAVEQLTPLLALALIEHLYRNRGDLPDDQSRVSAVIAPLRQYALSILMSERLETSPQEFESAMVGVERIKDLFRQQCRQLYPAYQTLITDRRWKENLQQYAYAIERVIAEDGISIVRGRRAWRSTKEAVADAFHIPGRSLTRLETLLATLENLIDKEEFSGRSPTSEVSLRFKVHPLEEEWLAKLEQSRKTVRLEGAEVPAVPVLPLITHARQSGYTPDEIQEIVRLLQARKYVDLDPRSNFLIRTVDNISDLRDAVARNIDALEHQVQVLTQLPDFEADRYPISRLRSGLEAATERDEIESLRGEARKYLDGLGAFIYSRTSILRSKLQQEQTELYDLIRQGVPPWLGREFSTGPLAGLLEKQREDLVAAYRGALEAVRQLRESSAKEMQAVTGMDEETVIRTYNLLLQLSKQARVLRTRLQSFEDRREDIKAWHEVSQSAVELQTLAETAQQVYGNGSFAPEIDRLWSSLSDRLAAQPLSLLGAHRDAAQAISETSQRVTRWLESRRQDFERQCSSYQEALAQAGIHTRLNIPFDQEHPAESYAALSRTVAEQASHFWNNLVRSIQSLQQVVRYSILVQALPLEETERNTRQVHQALVAIENQLVPQAVENLDSFRDETLAQLIALSEQGQALAEAVQQAIRPRPPEGSERRLLDLLAQSSPRQGADLRAMITDLLDQGEEGVNLEALMGDLQSLFQKNQIAIHISLLHEE